MLGNFECFFVVCEFKKSFRNITRVSKNLDTDQARRFVGPDLGPNCVQRLYRQTSKVATNVKNQLDEAQHEKKTFIAMKEKYSTGSDRTVGNSAVGLSACNYSKGPD